MANDSRLLNRLHNQQLSQQQFKTPREVVAHLCAMQSQDYGAAKWALGQRLSGATDEHIETAFTNGDILRTHVMRPTWHFVAPADIRWMLQLTASRVKAACAFGDRRSGLDDDLFRRSNKTLEKALRDGKQLTRTEITEALHRAKIDTSDLRLTHIMIRAEQDGIVCSGSRQGKQFTYALLEDRVPPAKKLTNNEALAQLTTRYFSSHGPATLQDFTWWSGFTISTARQGIELVKDQLINEEIDGQTYWMSNSTPAKAVPGKIYLLPNYDEYIVAYKDRTLLMDHHHNSKLDARGNVLFQNVIVYNGKVTGLWKRTIKASDVIVETTPFEPLSKTQQTAINAAVKEYRKFMLG